MLNPSNSASGIHPGSSQEQVWMRFLDELRTTVIPMALGTQTGVGVEMFGEWEWWTPRPDSGTPAVVEINGHSGFLGRVAVRPPSTALQGPFEGLLQAALRAVELEQNEASVVAELATNWESLEAVFQISASMGSLANTADLLQQILARAASLRSRLHAVLWLVREGRLEAAASFDCPLSPPRECGLGFVWQAIESENGIILTDAEAIAVSSRLEPEFAAARSVLIAPFRTRQGLAGAIALWRDRGPANFDACTLHFIQTLAMQAGVAVESEEHRLAQLASERLRQEVEIGSHIQQALLLTPAPQGMRRFSLATLTLPSRAVDGDFCDFFAHSSEVMDLVLGDVMGKGVPAALIGAATKNQLLRAINGLHGPSRVFPPPLAEILARTHQEVVPQLIQLERFVTLCYARLDSQRDLLELIDCGHTRTIHRSARTGQIGRLQGQSTPLGFTEEGDYAPLLVPFDTGDVFFFYSDGLTEAVNVDREFFGEERVAELIQQHGALPPDLLMQRVHQALVDFAGAGPYGDDLTAVIVRIENRPVIGLELPSSLTALPRLRAFVSGALVEVPFTALSLEARQELLLAVTEAASNIIQHSYPDRAGAPIFIDVDLRQEQIQVRLRHQGKPFSFPTNPTMSEGLQENGRGLFIIQQCADRVWSLNDLVGGPGLCLGKATGQPLSEGKQRCLTLWIGWAR